MSHKPCTLAPQHKWVFQRNIAAGRRISPEGVGCEVTEISLRGKYRCECGETRIGAANQNAEMPALVRQGVGS